MLCVYWGGKAGVKAGEANLLVLLFFPISQMRILYDFFSRHELSWCKSHPVHSHLHLKTIELPQDFRRKKDGALIVQMIPEEDDVFDFWFCSYLYSNPKRHSWQNTNGFSFMKLALISSAPLANSQRCRGERICRSIIFNTILHSLITKWSFLIREKRNLNKQAHT